MYAYVCTREHTYAHVQTHTTTHIIHYIHLSVSTHTHMHLGVVHTSSHMHAYGAHIYTNTYHLARTCTRIIRDIFLHLPGKTGTCNYQI